VRARAAALAAVALLLLSAPAAAAAAACPQTSLADIEDEVMCPVCGTSLELASEAPQAERQRAEIERLVASCASKDEIKARLVDELGEGVLALPGDSGFDLAAYVVPGLGILLAGGAVGAAAVGWRRTRGDDPEEDGGGGPSEASAERLQDDLDRYEL
jgi:cytochrome c-type biogenesis protein CcmH/NrfF